MNFRTTYILLGVVVVGLLALGIIVLTSDDKGTSPSVEGYLLRTLRAADVKPDAITSVEIDRPGQSPDKIAFVREGKSWVMVAPARARTDSAAVDSLVSSMLNARTEKHADLAPSLGPHGLENPPVKVTLKTDKLSETVSLGNVTIGGDKAVVYVTTTDRPDRPQAARRSDFFALFRSDAPKGATHAGELVKSVNDFRPLRVIGDGAQGPLDQVVRSLQVRAAKDEIALFREPGGTWKFRIPADYGEASGEAAEPFTPQKDPAASTISSVSQLINTISNIQPSGRDKIIDPAGDFARYGVDPAKSQYLQIDLDREDGVKETVYIGGPIKSEKEPDKYYARHEMDSVVYEVPAEPVKKVLGVLSNKASLRDRTVLRLTPMRIDAIDITTGGETIELRRVGFAWQLYDAAGKSRPANGRAINGLLERLTSRQLATGYPPPGKPDDKMGFTMPAVEIKLWEGGIVKEEKPDPNAKPKVSPTPTARLIFGHKDVGDVVHVRRLAGEAKADFFLPSDVFQLASRGRLDYIEPSMKGLDTNSVLKLSIAHGKEVLEVERADDKKPAAQTTWKINGPERLKGRPADASAIVHLLSQLSAIQPNRVVSDKVTEDVLNRLEVNPTSPRMKVTATVKDQGERVYLFGGDVGTEKKNVYFKPGDQELVFEVDRFAFDQFQKAEVQDMVVHRIDKVKIKAMKITGWQEVLGTPTTLEIERKDGKWALKSGGMFELDPAKVDSFLNDLTTPKAESFVVYKDGPKPEHNLDVAKNALSIELTMEEGDPVKMVISPPNKDGKVFATSSRSPGDVFTMPDRFATVRAKPAALKKD